MHGLLGYDHVLLAVNDTHDHTIADRKTLPEVAKLSREDHGGIGNGWV